MDTVHTTVLIISYFENRVTASQGLLKIIADGPVRAAVRISIIVKYRVKEYCEFTSFIVDIKNYQKFTTGISDGLNKRNDEYKNIQYDNTDSLKDLRNQRSQSKRNGFRYLRFFGPTPIRE